MRVKKLELELKLTGVGIPSIETRPPYLVDAALTGAGLLTDRFDGMGALEGEWADNRPFAFEGVFSLDGWDCERTYLEFEFLRGAGRVFVNGANAGEFDGGAARLDVTGCANIGANALKIEFAPGRARGILGDICLRGCWSAHIRKFALSAVAEGIAAEVCVSAHAAGRYTFSYAVSRGDEALDAFDFEAQLGARVQALKHSLPIGALAENSPSSPAPYRVRLTVLRAGDACDERVCYVAGEEAPGDKARRAVAFCDADCAKARLDLLLEAGARRFYAAPDAFLPREFLRRADEAGARVIYGGENAEGYACLTRAEAQPAAAKFAGMRLLAPPKRVLPEIALRALGAGIIFDALPDALPGGFLAGDVARLSRLTRYLQAQRVAGLAEGDPCAALGIGGGYGLAASYDLFDDGAPRPAYFALKAAWRARGVYAQPGAIEFDAGAQVAVPIFIRGEFAKVRAELFSLSGELLNRAEFDCGGKASGRIGELMFVLKRECAASVLRLTGVGADGACVRDYPICVRGRFALEALWALKPAPIKREGDIYVNMGDAVAFGPIRADGGSALLPGERAALDCAEGVNAVKYSELNG